MTFEPYPTRSGFVSLGVAIVFGAVAIFLLNSLLQQNDLFAAFQLFIGLLLALIITVSTLYWTIIAIKLRYYLDRNGVAIRWGLTQYFIPFEHIKSVVPGRGLPVSPKFWGLNIAGLRFGWSRLAEYGPLKFHTTASLADSLLIVASDYTYVISPFHPDQFLKAWQARQSLGPTHQWPTGVYRSWPLNTPLLVDSLAWWLLGLAGLVCLALFGYLAFVFPDLPASLPVHFNALGRTDRIADKSTLLILPTAGVIILVGNALLGELIYRQEKVAAYLLWGSAAMMQICLWVAVYTITA
jgi:uncharacterized membrane protein